MFRNKSLKCYRPEILSIEKLGVKTAENFNDFKNLIKMLNGTSCNYIIYTRQ